MAVDYVLITTPRTKQEHFRYDVCNHREVTALENRSNNAPFLGRVDDLSISALVKSIAEPSAAPKSVRPKRLNEDVVAHYSVRLSDARHDRERFDAVFMELQSDKRVKVAEADAIARQFVGGTSAYKKRADALKDIRLRFDASVAGDRRREASSEIF